MPLIEKFSLFMCQNATIPATGLGKLLQPFNQLLGRARTTARVIGCIPESLQSSRLMFWPCPLIFARHRSLLRIEFSQWELDKQIPVLGPRFFAHKSSDCLRMKVLYKTIVIQ